MSAGRVPLHGEVSWQKPLYVLFNVLYKVIDQSRERILRDIKDYYVVTVE